MTNSIRRGYALMLVLAMACWGVGTVLTKDLLAQVPPLTLLVMQLTASLLFMWPAILLRRRVRPVPLTLGRAAWRLSFAGLLNPGLSYTFGLLGLARTTASMFSLLWAAEPALILGLAWLLLSERLTRLQVLLSVLAVAGGVIVVTGAEPGMGGSLLGNGLVLVAVFCCASYTVLMRASVEQVDPLFLTTVQQSISFVLALLVWGVELRQGVLSTVIALPVSVWIWAALTGFMYYGLAFWFYITGLKQTSASLAALFLNLIPLFGLGAAQLMLGEQLVPLQWLGAVLILGAVITLSRLPQSALVPAAETSATPA